MTTKIEWTDETWNPTTGCTKVSEGCDNCYAERIASRFGGPGYFDTVRLHPDRLDKPLHWRKPRRVFVDSMSDLFHDDVPNEFIEEVFATMAVTPQHTYQILTKRPGRMASWFAYPMRAGMVAGAAQQRHLPLHSMPMSEWWPLPNVWLGVSVGNQKWADVRIPKLLETPAAVRFLSVEPMLGPVELSPWLSCPTCIGLPDYCSSGPRIDWVIVGGESGPGARAMHPDWVRSLRDQCQAASVPFFFKQWGEWANGAGSPGQMVLVDVGTGRRRKTDWDSHWPHVSTGKRVMTRTGKKAAGSELDGVEWKQYPDRKGLVA